MEFRTHDAVAVLAGVRALVLAHQGERLLGDRAHRLDVLLQAQIEHRAHMQAADRGVRVPGAARAMLGEDRGEPVGVFCKMLERHRAILDKGDRLARLLHRHHHIEAGGAHLRDGGLQLGPEHLDHAAPLPAAFVEGISQRADQLAQRKQATQVLAFLVLSELDKQDRLGIPAHDARNSRLEHLDPAREAEHGAIDQLDRDRSELDDVLSRLHGAAEAAEMAGPDGAPAAQQRCELQLDPVGKAERAFGADQDMREVELVAPGHERVEIVAADPALHLREALRHGVGLARAERQQVARQQLER